MKGLLIAVAVLVCCAGAAQGEVVVQVSGTTDRQHGGFNVDFYPLAPGAYTLSVATDRPLAGFANGGVGRFTYYDFFCGGDPCGGDDGLELFRFYRTSESSFATNFTLLPARVDLRRDDFKIVFRADRFTGGYLEAVDAREPTIENPPTAISYTLTIEAVPEPATWALMIAGFGMLGYSARRRRCAQASPCEPGRQTNAIQMRSARIS